MHAFPTPGQALLLYGSVYLFVVWVIGGTTGIWRYGLDWNYGLVVAAYVLVPILAFATFMLWLGVARLRESAACGARKVEGMVSHPHSSHEQQGKQEAPMVAPEPAGEIQSPV